MDDAQYEPLPSEPSPSTGQQDVSVQLLRDEDGDAASLTTEKKSEPSAYVLPLLYFWSTGAVAPVVKFLPVFFSARLGWPSTVSMISGWGVAIGSNARRSGSDR